MPSVRKMFTLHKNFFNVIFSKIFTSNVDFYARLPRKYANFFQIAKTLSTVFTEANSIFTKACLTCLTIYRDSHLGCLNGGYGADDRTFHKSSRPNSGSSLGTKTHQGSHSSGKSWKLRSTWKVRKFLSW